MVNLRPCFTPSNLISTQLTITLTFDHIFQSQELGKCGLDALWKVHHIQESLIQLNLLPINEEKAQIKINLSVPYLFSLLS